MKVLTLYRYDLGKDNTHGLLFLDGVFFCDTLELPWKENTQNISSVPTGLYSINLEYSAKLKQNVYRVTTVPGRLGILIHSANRVEELEGCIAVGIKNVELVSTSVATLANLVSKVGPTAVLKITNL